MPNVSKSTERKVVALYKAGEGKTPITQQCGIKAHQMYAILDKHRVPLRPRGTRSVSAKTKWPEATIREMCDLAERIPVTAVLARYPGLDSTTFWRYRTERGYESKRNIKSWDRRFFRKRNATVAYWAGFIMADGNLVIRSPGHSSVNLGVQETDEPHLERFRKAVGSTHSIVRVPSSTAYLSGQTIRSRPFRRIHMSGGATLPEDLAFWGVVSNKTYHWVEPQVTDRLLRHFLRGWFDGDGTTDYRKSGQQYFKVTGNRKALEWYADKLKELGVTADPYFTKPQGDGPACDMRINGRWQVLHIASVLYREGDECLPRKWTIALHPDWQKRKQAQMLCRPRTKPAGSNRRRQGTATRPSPRSA